MTAARVRLLPRPEMLGHLFCSVDENAQLPRLVDRLADLRRRGVLDTGLHIGNGARSQATLRPALLEALRAQGWKDEPLQKAADAILRRNRSAWSSTTSLQGSPARIKDTWRQTREALSGIARLRLLTQPKLQLLKRVSHAFRFLPAVRKQRALLDALTPLLGLTSGVPSDSLLACTFPGSASDPCNSSRGLLFGLLIAPFDGPSLAELAWAADTVFRQHGFPLYITFNTVARDAVECVLTLLFDRSKDEETTRAHRCMDQITRAAARLGYPPYRASIASMADVVDQQNPFWQVVEALKGVFDPKNVIAPGRYNAI